MAQCDDCGHSGPSIRFRVSTGGGSYHKCPNCGSHDVTR